MYALCLDIGTSSLKGAVISSEGKLVSDGRIYYSKEVVWQQALSELAGKLDTSFFIDAVAVSGSGPTFIPLKKNNSIGAPLLWFEKKEKSPVSGKSLYLPKLIWLKENKPEEYENTEKFLTMDGYFNYLLTGECAAPIFDDRFIPFFWNSEDADKNGIGFDKLPALVHTGEKIGTVTKGAEKQFGIKSGTPVFAGGSDFLMAILGPALRIMPHISSGCTNISVRIENSAQLIEHDREQYDQFLCRALQALEAEGCPVTVLRMSGGQAKNLEWNQLRANVSGKRVLVPEIEDGELAGCACAAFSGLGLWESPARAAEAIVRIGREYIPE